MGLLPIAAKYPPDDKTNIRVIPLNVTSDVCVIQAGNVLCRNGLLHQDELPIACFLSPNPNPNPFPLGRLCSALKCLGRAAQLVAHIDMTPVLQNIGSVE